MIVIPTQLQQLERTSKKPVYIVEFRRDSPGVDIQGERYSHIWLSAPDKLDDTSEREKLKCIGIRIITAHAMNKKEHPKGARVEGYSNGSTIWRILE